MEKQKKTTICLSDEIKENFNEWLKSWDFKINSVDNRDNLEIAVSSFLIKLSMWSESTRTKVNPLLSDSNF